MAERLLEDMTPEEQEAIGLPDDLPEAQARCVAEKVAADPGVRVLFLLGSTDGSTPGAPGQFDDDLDRLTAYEGACA